MISTIPVWIMFISSILGIERTNRFQIAGVILSLLGVLFIITKSDLELIKNLDFNKGDLIMAWYDFMGTLFSFIEEKNYGVTQIALLEVVILLDLFFSYLFIFLKFILVTHYKLKPFILTLSYVVILPGLAAFFFG